jgi:hypothetical protein
MSVFSHARPRPGQQLPAGTAQDISVVVVKLPIPHRHKTNIGKAKGAQKAQNVSLKIDTMPLL